MKTKKEYYQLLNEVIEFYRHNQRATYKGTCSYYHRGNVCAIGMMMKEPQKFSGFAGAISALVDKYDFNDIIKPEYLGFEDMMYMMLQNLHDNDFSWEKTESGNALSKYGERQVEHIRDWIHKNI